MGLTHAMVTMARCDGGTLEVHLILTDLCEACYDQVFVYQIKNSGKPLNVN